MNAKRFSRLFIWLLPLIFWGLFGCGLVETYNETADLQHDIQEQYGYDGTLGVQYSVSTGTGNSIKIEWENSTTFSPDDPQIEEKTRELAQFVRDHYAGIDKVDNVWIVLVQSENVAVVNLNQTVSFIYDVDELEETEMSE